MNHVPASAFLGPLPVRHRSAVAPAILTTALGILLVTGGRAVDVSAAEPPADAWLTNEVVLPPSVVGRPGTVGDFNTLRAEVVAGRMSIQWTAVLLNSNATATLYFSIDGLGHWPARDWQKRSMTRRERTLFAVVPVTDVDLPVVYFIAPAVSNPGADGMAGLATNFSPPRVCRPRAAGLTEPSHVFWPFLDGFEEGLDGWRLVTPNAPPLRLDSGAHTGHRALALATATNQKTVTLATTRVRGWHLTSQRATGLQLWVRTSQGEGQVQLAAVENAFSPRQRIFVHPRPWRASNAWQSVRVHFDEMPGLTAAELDLLTLQFGGAGATEFLLDDLQLLGPWKDTSEKAE